MTACAACGHDPGETVVHGPLTVTTEPAVAYWRGIRLFGLRPTHLRILALLAARGKASHLALILSCLGEDTHDSALKAHISQMRRLLPEGIRITTVWGWGYQLETVG